MNVNEGVYGKQENSETEKLHVAYKKNYETLISINRMPGVSELLLRKYQEKNAIMA